MSNQKQSSNEVATLIGMVQALTEAIFADKLIFANGMLTFPERADGTINTGFEINEELIMAVKAEKRMGNYCPMYVIEKNGRDRLRFSLNRMTRGTQDHQVELEAVAGWAAALEIPSTRRGAGTESEVEVENYAFASRRV